MEESIQCPREVPHDTHPTITESTSYLSAVGVSMVPKVPVELDYISSGNYASLAASNLPILGPTEECQRWRCTGIAFAKPKVEETLEGVRLVGFGTDRIGQLEHWVVSNVKKIIPYSVQNWWSESRAALSHAETEQLGSDDISEAVEMAGWGVEEAERRNKAEASLGTQLALAYAIHKSFIFLRVPLTAAVTPKVVKVLRSWGWQIGKRRSK
ncbi:uncharacterized protein GLRG_04228 [Colletotrichum graminicola M1.001]|uniref:DUF1279 domain-containing protein n=1 Tax=Colletotrichum graminicola (strain M1.001 / M2 / FGSC 10212) TaxID=645133 RepID=E3QDZ6_COLGM|nr:uncharacterized protein GLRG_04228 [Colletotrichum graminicola M1.001]EFQ29084.1 hypothetical protein GLRG_04228 [Colletotrichum graminicola M1.001]